MKVLLFSLLSVLFFPTDVHHDVPVATFTVYEEEGDLLLNVEFDSNDFLNSTEMKKDSVSSSRLEAYLNKQTSWVLNSEKLQLMVTHHDFRNGHLFVYVNLGKLPNKLTELRVENSCLINVSHQTNNVIIKLTDERKGYRMHKDRTSISVDL